MEVVKVVGLVVLSMVLGLVLGSMESFDFKEKDLESEESLWGLYERWRSHYSVARDMKEKQERFSVFKENAKYIQEFNKKDEPYKLELNMFGDMTNDEISSKYTGYKGKQEERSGGFMHKKVRPPRSVDWRKLGAVTPIKGQGDCGSCCAFSTVVAVEGINQIKTQKLITLSEQQLVDCDREHNRGCKGGRMIAAYEYIKKKGGITSDKNYPYKAKQGTCNHSKVDSPLVTIDGYERVPQNDENALMKAVAMQPVSVAINVGRTHIPRYSKGVFNGTCGKRLDHGVAVVGYGKTRDGTKYWLIKNSWGPGWGEKGYMRLRRDVPVKEGLCGITLDASYPLKKTTH